ncbi:MAG: exodeoxyribonuclease VII small subunit [Chitinispirillaceae bacterium]|nr:exodeoxyribonuclease VII small subunit [Chitinispirillaceae bacterium]
MESVVKRLENDDLTLDSALSHFERVIYLMPTCDTHPNKTRGKIIDLFRGQDWAFAEKVLGMSLNSGLLKKKFKSGILTL